jgi:N-hydroxyarylamine O-acetyltransferase
MIYELRASEQVKRYLNRPLMLDHREAEEFVEEMVYGMRKGIYLYWVIVRRADEQLLGTICLWQFNAPRTQADLGYELLTNFQGQGVMTEVLSRIIAYARDTLGLERLYAFTHRENTPSKHLLAAAGFTYEKDAEYEANHVIYAKYLTGLPAYLQRIGLPPNSKPSLLELQQAHLYQVPFENLDIHLGLSVSIQFEDVFRKVVHQRRGGFCYEHNSLFRWAMGELGYRAHLIQAQVYSKDKEEYGPPFDHMAVWVEMEEGPYLADVGYGNAPLIPMPVQHGATAEGTNGAYYIAAISKGSYQLYHKEGGAWVPDYIFGLHARRLEEFEPMALYHQTASESPFTQKRLISLPLRDGGRVSISGHELKITAADGSQEVTELATEEDFLRALKRYFNVWL